MSAMITGVPCIVLTELKPKKSGTKIKAGLLKCKQKYKYSINTIT